MPFQGCKQASFFAEECVNTLHFQGVGVQFFIMILKCKSQLCIFLNKTHQHF